MLRRGLSAACLAVLAISTISAPAASDMGVVHDRKGDTGGAPSDITRVTIEHGSHDGRRLVVAAAVGSLEIGDVPQLWIDTRGHDRGPEFRMVMHPNSDVMGLAAVERWHQHGQYVRCRGLRGRADAFGRDVVRFSIPVRCLGAPQRVRASVQMRSIHKGRRTVDWAPGLRRFSPWVRR